MRIEVLGNLDNVVTAIYYTWKGNLLFPPKWDVTSGYFVPEDLVPQAEIIQYKSSSSSIDLKDFKEYNYKLFPDKGKYSDYNIMDLYGDKTREIIGNDPGDIEKISKYAISTIYVDKTEDTDTIGYFKSKILSGGRVVYQFHAPENCYKIELYDSILSLSQGEGNSKNGHSILDADFENKCAVNFIKRPIISIYLGPTDDNILNPDKFYYGNNSKPEEMKVLTTAQEYRGLIEEITCAKIVTLVSSLGNVENFSVDIPQSCFYESKDSLRNLNTIALRNDEWYGSVNSINQVSVRDGNLYDLTTGTLLGNQKITNTPLLDLKRDLARIKTQYSQDHTYSKGDVTLVGKLEYVSLSDNNKGNQPLVSPLWMLKTEFDNSFTKTIDLVITPIISGHTSKSYLVYDSGSPISFEFIPEYGFELNQYTFNNKPDVLRTGKANLIKDTDFEYQETLSTSGKVTRKIKIIDWEKILETGKIIISPEVKSKKCIIRVLYRDKYYSLFDTPRLQKYPGNDFISGADVVLNGKIISDPEILNNLSAISSLTNIGVSGINTKALDVKGINATYTYSDLTTKEVALEKQDDDFIDREISSEVIYTIIVEDRNYNCRVFYNTENWEVEDTCPIGYYNKPLTIRFYSINPSAPLKRITVYDETGENLLYNYSINNTSIVLDENGMYSITIPSIVENLKIFIVD